MNCMNKIEIQKYIDKECSANEKIAIEAHLLECNSCTQNLRLQDEQSSSIKKALAQLNASNLSIPEFRKPVKTKFQKIEHYIIYSLSAACLLLFVLIFVDKVNPKKQNQLALMPTWEIDSNRPITEQAIMVSVTDPNGNSTEFFIE